MLSEILLESFTEHSAMTFLESQFETQVVSINFLINSGLLSHFRTRNS